MLTVRHRFVSSQIQSYIGTIIAAIVQVVALLSYLAAYCASSYPLFLSQVRQDQD